MDKAIEEEATLEALLQRFKDYRLPRAERMLDRVEAGQPLSDEDIQWLERVIADGHVAMPLVRAHHEYDRLLAGAMALFAKIIELGVANEPPNRRG